MPEAWRPGLPTEPCVCDVRWAGDLLYPNTSVVWEERDFFGEHQRRLVALCRRRGNTIVTPAMSGLEWRPIEIPTLSPPLEERPLDVVRDPTTVSAELDVHVLPTTAPEPTWALELLARLDDEAEVRWHRIPANADGTYTLPVKCWVYDWRFARA